MSTPRQERLADAIIANATAKKQKNKKELVISSGYAVKTAEGHAPEIIGQKGVRDALEARGFDVATAKQVVGRILRGEKSLDKDKLKAADMVFKVHGAYAPETEAPSGNTYNFFLNPAIRDATQSYEEKIKQALALTKPEHGG